MLVKDLKKEKSYRRAVSPQSPVNSTDHQCFKTVSESALPQRMTLDSGKKAWPNPITL